MACGLAFVWLLSLWPAIYFIADNFDDVAAYRFDGTLQILSVSATVPLLASVVGLALWFRKKDRATQLVLFGAASLNPLLFCYSAIVALSTPVGIHHGALALCILLCISAFFVLGLLLRTERLQQGALVVAVVLVGFNVAKMTYAGAQEGRNPAVKSLAVSNLQMRPSILRENIYYVLLDSYPGPITTSRVLGYDNPLPGMLTARGFFSSGNFKTNYFATFLTMSSVLDANYDVTEKSSFPLDKAEKYPIHLLGGYVPAAIRALQAAGFKTYFVGNWYARCAEKVFACLGEVKIEQSMAFGTFIDATPAARFFPAVASDDAIASRAFDKLYDAISPLTKNVGKLAHSRQHFFVFAHNMAPHPPTEYNPDCSWSGERQTVNLNWLVKKESYLAALKCVNLKVLALLDEIDRRDPDALVVIQSDHGSFTQANGSIVWDSISPSLMDEMTYPINFIRAPTECQSWLYKGMAQVNTMRFMLGCAMRQKPNYLPDDTYIGHGQRDVDGPFVLVNRQRSHEKD